MPVFIVYIPRDLTPLRVLQLSLPIILYNILPPGTPFVDAQWLSGRVLDSKPKGRGFEPHRRHCVVSLSKNINPSLALVHLRKTHPDVIERLLTGT